MLKRIVAHTHYWPHDADAEQAVCGAAMTTASQHSTSPTCPDCAAYLFAQDYCYDRVEALAHPATTPTAAAAADFALVSVYTRRGGRR